MGKHTAYWRAYAKAQVGGTLRVFAAIAGWLGVVALLSLAHARLGSAFPWLLGACFAGLALTLVALGRTAYRVDCPECATRYERAKIGGQCPRCGLRLMQADP